MPQKIPSTGSGHLPQCGRTHRLTAGFQLVYDNPLSFGSWHALRQNWDALTGFQGDAILLWLRNSALYAFLALVITLAAAFGVPLVNGITHLAGRLPGYVASAQHGNGWIGHLVARYHVHSWVQRNTPRLAACGWPWWTSCR